ncbi:MAG: dihydroneopterin aldolase [Thalassobaculales bacterium]
MTADTPAPAAETTAYHLTLSDLTFDMRIGVNPGESAPQPVRLAVSLEMVPQRLPRHDAIAGVFSYDRIADLARGLAAEGHVGLVETFAQRLADRLLADNRVAAATVRLEKLRARPDAVVGCTVTRRRSGP